MSADPLGLVPVDPAAKPAAPPQTVTLPNSRAAGSWTRATDALLAALEREEAEAMAAFEAVKARAQAARRAANALRQLRGMVRVDAASPSPASSKRWARQHDACINCGTTTLRHASRGRCDSCQSYFARCGQDREVPAS